MEKVDVLKNGTVIETHRSCLVVEVEGVELYVGTTVNPSGCECCLDAAEFDISYNRKKEDRIDAHGKADPLNIN